MTLLNLNWDEIIGIFVDEAAQAVVLIAAVTAGVKLLRVPQLRGGICCWRHADRARETFAQLTSKWPMPSRPKAVRAQQNSVATNGDGAWGCNSP
jgi:hypothetical protein